MSPLAPDTKAKWDSAILLHQSGTMDRNTFDSVARNIFQSSSTALVPVDPVDMGNREAGADMIAVAEPSPEPAKAEWKQVATFAYTDEGKEAALRYIKNMNYKV